MSNTYSHRTQKRNDYRNTSFKLYSVQLQDTQNTHVLSTTQISPVKDIKPTKKTVSTLYEYQGHSIYF